MSWPDDNNIDIRFTNFSIHSPVRHKRQRFIESEEVPPSPLTFPQTSCASQTISERSTTFSHNPCSPSAQVSVLTPSPTQRTSSPLGLTLTSAPVQEPKSINLPAEVLQRVFCFLDQRSQRSARFVAKEWFNVSCRYVSYILSNSKQPPTYNDFLQRISFTSRLEWNMFIAWQPLRDALQYAKPRVANQRPLPPSFLNLGPRTLIVPLRSLTVNGNTTTYYLHMFPELDVFKDLVSLSIRYSKANYAAIRSIFKTCSSLQHLRLDGNSHITESISPMVAHSLARVDFVVPQLKILIIVKPDLSFAQILDLLGTQHSLQELELRKLCVVHKNQGNIHVTIRHSLEAGILAYLREHGSSLQCLHVTIVQTDGDVTDYGPSSKHFRDDLIQACPHVLEWGALLDTNGYCSMIQPLTNHPNMVTALHLQSGASQAFPRWQRNTFDLDRYLCQAPFLLHLRVPKMVGLPESMFAFRDMDSTMHWIGNSATPARRQPVWVCRGLKTLSIGFWEPYWETDKIWNYYDGSKQARVVFGYLSRVCPDLKELEIHLHLNNLFLETGLCLLTRMKQLRKLEVRLGKGTWELAPRIEIDWMNVESVGRDAGVGAEWQARRKNPDQLPWNILEPEEGAIIESRGGTKIQRNELEFDSEQARYQGQPVRDGLQVSDPWEYLGMFADVESVSRELQIAAWEGRHCWAEMKTLTICNAWGKSNEAEVVIRKLRPDIESLEFQEPWY